ncbi:MAG: hypothetical protein JSR99_09925 [Proteobacteria bacterium]|nr:hypothetical protein [Pseudomonadota bacterium]
MGELFDGLMDAWIPDATNVYSERVGNDPRFADGKKLFRSFEEVTKRYRERRSKDDIKAVEEKCNELAAATTILSLLQIGQALSYEPKLAASNQSIDFLINSETGRYLWIDVKTVNPQWIDTEAEWSRFDAIMKEVPEASRPLTNMGGIADHMLKSRWSLYSYAAQIEKKMETTTDEEREAPVSVLFCGNGFAWHLSALEDFVDFYATGNFRSDDWASKMMTRYMQDKGIEFKRTIAGFHSLQRGQFETLPKLFSPFVRGPNF